MLDKIINISQNRNKENNYTIIGIVRSNVVLENETITTIETVTEEILPPDKKTINNIIDEINNVNKLFESYIKQNYKTWDDTKVRTVGIGDIYSPVTYDYNKKIVKRSSTVVNNLTSVRIDVDDRKWKPNSKTYINKLPKSKTTAVVAGIIVGVALTVIIVTTGGAVVPAVWTSAGALGGTTGLFTSTGAAGVVAGSTAFVATTGVITTAVGTGLAVGTLTGVVVNLSSPKTGVEEVLLRIQNQLYKINDNGFRFVTNPVDIVVLTTDAKYTLNIFIKGVTKEDIVIENSSDWLKQYDYSLSLTKETPMKNINTLPTKEVFPSKNAKGNIDNIVDNAMTNLFGDVNIQSKIIPTDKTNTEIVKNFYNSVFTSFNQVESLYNKLSYTDKTDIYDLIIKEISKVKEFYAYTTNIPDDIIPIYRNGKQVLTPTYPTESKTSIEERKLIYDQHIQALQTLYNGIINHTVKKPVKPKPRKVKKTVLKPVVTDQNVNITNIYDKYELVDTNLFYDCRIKSDKIAGAIVKIPAIGSSVFLNKLSNESYYVQQASEYVQYELKKDVSLKLKLDTKDIEFTTDNFLMNPWFNCITYDQKSKTNFISDIYSININNQIILNNNLEIVGNKVGIGLSGVEKDVWTPFDEDYTANNNISNKYLDILKQIRKIMPDLNNSNNYRYIFNAEFDVSNDSPKPISQVLNNLLNKDITDVLENSYLNETLDSLMSIRYEYRKFYKKYKELSVNDPNMDKVINEKFIKLSKTIGYNLVNIFVNFLPTKNIYNVKNVLYNGTDIYNIVDYDFQQWYNTITERDYKTEDASDYTQMLFIYSMVRYLLYKSVANYFEQKKKQYLIDNPISANYTESFKSIFQDLTSVLQGLQSFSIINGIQKEGLPNTKFKTSLQEIDSNNNDLFYI